jgi:hypothetical protein
MVNLDSRRTYKGPGGARAQNWNIGKDNQIYERAPPPLLPLVAKPNQWLG